MLEKVRQKLVANAANIFRMPVKLMPTAIQNMTLLEGLKLVFKEALEDGDFEFLEGKWLKVSVNDMDLSWFISCDNGKLLVSTEQVEHHVSFSGSLNDLVLIAGRKEDPDTLFFQRRLSIEGDTELGLEVKNLMDSVDLDALPKTVKMGLDQLSTFVSKGVQTSSDSYSSSVRETENAY
ncbi:sterol-binding protein [Vibrio sp. UCD-FRSSP16_10]|uniref:ubiquinone anaerobic biosynthesis accessory factor UbiT n=1 Tax=unclassified Vibrio TaxID=2614977 RepID=UPI0008000D25|nr:MULTISPECIES: SCP2 domain-containing protein [unclassified Vibrio]OBT06661.1 sterol-binding protein [Vibrio sp. UCD-FRSSP16_30]OBT12358.1 sterol-binding protein [Vibrio sp. UCD-FRSSP16_10]